MRIFPFTLIGSQRRNSPTQSFSEEVGCSHALVWMLPRLRSEMLACNIRMRVVALFSLPRGNGAEVSPMGRRTWGRKSHLVEGPTSAQLLLIGSRAFDSQRTS